MTPPTGRPLAGRSVVVTRSRAQASQLVERLVALGAVVVELPVVATAPPHDGGEALGAAADRLVAGRYAWVVCSSTTAATRLADALGDGGLGSVPAGVRWAAIGPGTAATLEARGRRADLVPGRSVGEALVEAFPVAPIGALPVLFPRAAEVRPVVADGLRAAGWVVDEVEAYRTVPEHPDGPARALAAKAELIAFTSASTVRRTLEVLGRAGIPAGVVSIGPITSAAAAEAGLGILVEADRHDLDGLVDAVCRAAAAVPLTPPTP